MLRKRIIFTLIYSQGYFMQSRNFRLQKVGDIDWLETNYQFKKIAFSLDELIVLNATRDNKSIEEFSTVIRHLSQDVFIPISAGGGIRSIKDAEMLFNNGADKIILNSALHDNTNLVRSLIKQYGSQAITASIDYKTINNINKPYILDGTKEIEMNLQDYIAHVEKLEIGEIYLNSITQDGTGFGYDFTTIDNIASKINLPIIIAGGAGNDKHLYQRLLKENVSAVATANLFNFIGDGLLNAREKILKKKINIASWHFI